MMFQYNMIPTINKSIHVIRNIARTANHSITNTGIERRSEIVKTDISDHVLIVFVLKTCEQVSQKIRHNLFINLSTEKDK